MIDNEETGQVEELDDIVVDLAEDEGKQPEETSDTESPVSYTHLTLPTTPYV